MSAGAEAWRVWAELRRAEEQLSWGGAPRPGRARFDSLGRPQRTRFDGEVDESQGPVSRVQRVQYALRHAGPHAQKRIGDLMQGLDLDSAWPVLLAVCEEIVLLRGVAAAPGAKRRRVTAPALHAMRAREWLVEFIGLAPQGDATAALIPGALRSYERGFRQAWGPTRDDRRRPLDVNGAHGNVLEAALDFVKGHVILVGVLLTLLAAHLSRPGADRATLIQEVRDAGRLGPVLADWLVANGESLVSRLRAGAAPARAVPVAA